MFYLWMLFNVLSVDVHVPVFAIMTIINVKDLNLSIKHKHRMPSSVILMNSYV